MGSIEDFISKGNPHGKENNHPPSDPILRHEWECKQLYTVVDCLHNDCTVLDYGCGGAGTLQHTLFDYYPGAKYYGLDAADRLTNPPEDNVTLGNIDSLSDVLPNVDCMVMGSIFTHFGWEEIEKVLNKTLPYYESGFQLGFTTFLGEYQLYRGNWYNPETWWIAIIPLKQYQDWCDMYDLQLIVHDYKQYLDHPLPLQKIKHQDFLTIKKKENIL